VFKTQNATLITTHKGEINDNIKFLQPYHYVTADKLFDIGKAIISAVLSRVKHSSQTLRVSQSFLISRCTIVLFGTSFSGYALLNATRADANDVDAK
jgi:hypothetical protein